MDLKWMSIDPGISTGLAVFNGRHLKDWGVYTGRGKDWIEKYEDVSLALAPLFIRMRIQKTFIEWPSFQKFPREVVKLGYLIGKLSVWGKTILVPVSKWRGSCPKEILWRRAEKYFGLQKEVLKNHEGDCVAMAQFLLENKLVDIRK